MPRIGFPNCGVAGRKRALQLLRHFRTLQRGKVVDRIVKATYLDSSDVSSHALIQALDDWALVVKEACGEMDMNAFDNALAQFRQALIRTLKCGRKPRGSRRLQLQRCFIKIAPRWSKSPPPPSHRSWGNMVASAMTIWPRSFSC